MKTSQLQESFAFINSPKGKEISPPFEVLELQRLAAQGIYIGTNSWKYRGWEGLIYQGGYSSEAQFQRVSLREYSSCFPTVGADFTYYTWPLADMIAFLAESTPENFKLCMKVTKRITWKKFPEIPVYGKWAGKNNPDFLDIDQFCVSFLKPISLLQHRSGPLHFDFPELTLEDLPLLEAFLAKVPKGAAFEVRKNSIPNLEFISLLKKYSMTPVLELSTLHRSLIEQAKEYNCLQEDWGQSPIFIKANVRFGRTEEEATKLFQPFSECRDPNAEAIAEIAALIRHAISMKRKLYLLVSNKFEGSAPHSIGNILRALHTSH